MTITNSEIFGIVLAEQLRNWEGPSLRVRFKKKGNESYNASFDGEGLSLDVTTPASFLTAMRNLEIGLKSGYIEDFMSHSTTPFSWRILWLQGEWDSIPMEQVCLRVARLGFNAVLLEDPPQDSECFKAYGIHLILKPRIEELGSKLVEWIASVPFADALFWEGTFHKRKSRDLLLKDFALEELHALESAASGLPVIFKLPDDLDGEWIPEFLDEAGEKTTIAFNSMKLTKRFRKFQDLSSTPLLTVINGGLSGEGDGLWPVIPIDLLEDTLADMRFPSSQGCIVTTKSIPNEGSFLDGALWTVGNALWKERPPRSLLSAWCGAYYSDIESILYEINRVANHLRLTKGIKLSPEEAKTLGSALLGQLDRIEVLAERSGNQKFKDYCIYFLRDARKITAHFLQANHLPLINVIKGNDLLESFWASVPSTGGGGLAAGFKVIILDKALSGAEGSPMNRIYKETFPFIN